MTKTKELIVPTKSTLYNTTTRKRKRHMPTKEDSGVDWDEVCDAAANYGIILYANGGWVKFEEKPRQLHLKNCLGGAYKQIQVPSQGLDISRIEQPTVLIVGVNVPKETPSNSTARYITMIDVKGTAIWLPKKYVNWRRK